MGNDGERSAKTKRLIVTLIGGACLAAALTWVFYRQQVTWAREEQGRALLTIADIKASAIASWRRERIADGHGVPRNVAFARFLRRYFRHQPDPAAEREIRAYFDLLRANHDYSAIRLYDAHGKLRLCSGLARCIPEPRAAGLAVKAVMQKQVVFEDFHSPDGQSIHLSVIGPVCHGESAAIGAIEFRIDPSRYLYQHIQTWPTPSRSGETLLARREADEVVFLNELRHRKGTALNLRLPLRAGHLPAARASLGQEGLFEGLDYRGIPVLSALRGVPDSPWFLVAKVDKSEAYAGARSRTRYFAGITALFVTLSGFGLLLAWSRRDARHFQQLYAAESERRALVSHYEYLHRYASDAIMLFDEEGRVVDANDRTTELYGYPRDKLLTMRVADLRHPSSLDAFPQQWREASNPHGVLFETLHQRADGSAFPVEVSSRSIQVDKRVYRHSIIRDISERKRAEAAIVESQARLQLAVDSAELATWELDIDAGIVTASDRALAVFGFDNDERALECWLARIHPDDRSQVQHALRDAVASRARYDREYRVVLPDRSVRWVTAQGVMIDAENRRSARMLGIIQDITTRKEAESALRASEERFRAAFDHAAIGMALVSAEGRFTSVNSAFCEMLGYSCSELVGKHYRDITHPDDLQIGVDVVAKMIAGESPRAAFEKRYRRKDGTAVWVQLSTAILRGGTQAPAGFITQIQDVTERRIAEQALRESQADLNRAQAVAHIGSWRLDIRRDQLTWSAEAHRIFEISEGTPLTYEIFLASVHPEDRELVDRSWQAALRGEPYDVEHRILVEGRVKWVRERAELEIDAEGRLQGGFGTVQDITDRKHAEEEIRRLNAELEQRVRDRTAQLEAANEELEAFAYSVSHDLRAPLRGVDGWSLALLEDYAKQLDARGQRYLERVRSEAQRMGMLIDDLLQLSRLNRTEMKHGEVDLTRVSEGVASRLREAHPERVIQFAIAPGLKASGDVRLLEVAMTNLLGNAVKFTGRRAQAQIEVGKVRYNGESAFYVRDNGAGFDMAYAGKLFGPFQRLHKTSDFPGTGIGLATVQRVIRRHGGRVWAEAQPDGGATFYFVLGKDSERESNDSAGGGQPQRHRADAAGF